MNKLYDALENCLQALEHGQSIDAALVRYPDLARELRPLLEVSLHARTSGRTAVPGEVQRRGRARLLQRASEMREAKSVSRRRAIPTFPRLAITLGLASVFVLTSTGLVSASSGSLPGDQLYSVKRTWENLRILFVFSPVGRDLLESQYEQERLDEIDELLGKGRSAPIMFSGLVTKQQDGQWMISGIPVTVTASTRLPITGIPDGAPVMITGTTRGDGTVEAQEIQLLQPGVPLPPLEPSESEDHNGGGEQEDSSAISTPVVAATPRPSETQLQSSTQEQKSYEFSGVVESVQANVWRINGQAVYVDQAIITGQVRIGTLVKFEGYYSPDGKFIVTKIEAQSGNDSGSSGHDNGGQGSGDSGGGSSGDGGGDGSHSGDD